MGSCEAKEIKEIQPPKNVAEANCLFLEKYGDNIKSLDFLHHDETQQLYTNSAVEHKTHPIHMMTSDLSTITTVCARSGLKFQDSKKCGVMSPNRTYLANGTSSGGKTQAIIHSDERILRLSHSVGEDIRALPAFDDDGDAEMTPFVNLSNANWDVERTADVGWNRRSFNEYLRQFFSGQGVQSHSSFMDDGGDRMKALYQGIMCKRGFCRLSINELGDKMQSLTEAGDANVGNFFIQLSDKIIPDRKYSTKKLSTPKIKNAAVSALCGTTSETYKHLISEFGEKGVARRVIGWYAPIFNTNIFDIMDIIDRMDANRDNDDIDEKQLEDHRLKELWKLMMYKTEEEQKNEDDASMLFKKSIPFIDVRLESEVLLFQRQYVRENADDKKLENIRYPDDWTDDKGILLTSKKTQADWYFDLCQHVTFNIEDKDLSDICKILLNTRISKWSSIAFALTARKKMLEIKRLDQEINWEPFVLDTFCCEDALFLTVMSDYYTILMSLIPKKSSGFGTPININDKQQLQILKTEFMGYILDLLIKHSKPSITSSELTRKLKSKKFKALNNLKYMQLLCQKLVKYNLVDLEDASNSNANKKWVKKITRKQMSTLNLSETQKKEIKEDVFVELDCSLRQWSSFWQSEEIKFTNQF